MALTPPAGHERVVAVWTRAPLQPQTVLRLAGEDRSQGRGPSRVTTRNLERVPAALGSTERGEWQAAVLALLHEP